MIYNWGHCSESSSQINPELTEKERDLYRELMFSQIKEESKTHEEKLVRSAIHIMKVANGTSSWMSLGLLCIWSMQ